MRRSFLLTCMLLGFAAGCSDTFTPPPLPDLGKVPYDFAVDVPPFSSDMGLPDVGTSD